MKTQFIVQEQDERKRELFYNYIHKTYDLKDWYPFDKEKYIKINFPFVIDFKEKSFWVCDSITCCACAAQAKVIYSIYQFP